MPTDDSPLPLYEAPAVRDRFGIAARKTQQQYWDNQAAGWSAERSSHGLQPRHLCEMASRLADPVLLVGAGRGTMLRALHERGYIATGVDWSTNMVEEARRDGLSGLSHGCAGHLPHGDGSLATVIVSTGVLLPTHTPERRDRYLSEACRVLAPAGHLVLCLWLEEGSAAARRAAENVKLPIHTLQAQVHWDLSPLAASLSALDFQTVDQIKCDDLFIWSLAKAGMQF